MNRTIGCAALFAASLTLYATPAAAQEDVVALEPSDSWRLVYAPDSCGLSRTFGEGEGAVLLQMRQYAPGGPLSTTIVSQRASDPRLDAELSFGPEGEARQLMEPMPISLDDGYAGVRLRIATGIAATGNSVLAGEDAERDQAEAAIRYLRVDDVFADDVILQTGSMHAAFAAMRECQLSLVEYWGFDKAEQSALQRSPTLVRDDRWVGVALRRMPDRVTEQARNTHQFVRLFSDAEGNITDCAALSPNDNPDFAASFCEQALMRGSLSPAVNADGVPTAGVSVYGMGIRTRAEPYYAETD